MIRHGSGEVIRDEKTQQAMEEDLDRAEDVKRDEPDEEEED